MMKNLIKPAKSQSSIDLLLFKKIYLHDLFLINLIRGKYIITFLECDSFDKDTP